jgi:hypothetical protein
MGLGFTPLRGVILGAAEVPVELTLFCTAFVVGTRLEPMELTRCAARCTWY